MSQENVEIVRRSVEAWNRRDLRTWLASFDSYAELDWSRARGPFKGVYRGHRELAAFSEEFWSTFEDVQLETYGFAEAGSEIVYSNTAHMRGRGSKWWRGAHSCSPSKTGRSLAFGCSRSGQRAAGVAGL
jgi:ketosteroid isomerase-like protein